MALSMARGRTGLSNPFSGPHLPVGPGKARSECFRCADDRRVLRLYLVGRGQTTVGGMLLCDLCATSLLPLNPDPLDVTTAA